MAHFRGTLQGMRGEASRLGSKTSGLQMTAASWQGACDVYLTEKDGIDYVRVVLSQHHGAGCYPSRVLYDGPINGKQHKVAQLAPIHAALFQFRT